METATGDEGLCRRQDPIGSVTLGQLDAAAFTAMPCSIATTHTPMHRAAVQEADCRPHGCPTARHLRILAVCKHARRMHGATTYPRRQSQAAHLCAAIPRIPDHPADVCTATHWMPLPQHPSASSVYPRPPLHPHGPLCTPQPPLYHPLRLLGTAATLLALFVPSGPLHAICPSPLPAQPLPHTLAALLASSAPSAHPHHLPSTLRALQPLS
ncbi:hypothetical protein K439DRAFT_1619564 [Ramaria rubella]|nr:hypothetical protein K439DRAFT_1619564 [Ramaria rubella]